MVAKFQVVVYRNQKIKKEKMLYKFYGYDMMKMNGGFNG